ncbi:MAG: multidrug efflux RND transporter permease subunit [Desulfovibrionaceae bacterium]
MSTVAPPRKTLLQKDSLWNIAAPFIRRPVATTLLTLAITLAGVVAFVLLPVSPLPQVDFPTIRVFASLPGASPETMAATVATPLERALGRIAGVTEMTSSSSLGSTNVILQFDLNRDINGAASDVQAAINAARADLPTMPSNPSYRKMNPADAPIMILAVTSPTMTRPQMYDAASTVLAQKISQLAGVGQVMVSGAALPAVRVEINPDALNQSGISLESVRQALAASNAHLPKGMLDNTHKQWFVGANDQARSAAEFRPLIIAVKDGVPVRLADVALVEDGPQDLRNLALDGDQPAVLLIVFRSPGANIIETVDRINAMLPQLKSWLPESATLRVTMDRSPTIRASLKEVEKAMVWAMALVVLVVFLFLRNGRATLIPAVAAPVSLIGTFAVMYLCGYSLDNLSLMALTIATGFVVDDAIVVLENIVRHIENGSTPYRAALRGAREVGFTVLSISLSLVAVFIPILFMGGIVGRMFREFAVVLSTTVLVSMVVSLTTTPMMCAQLLRPVDESPPAAPSWFSRFSALWGNFLDAMQEAYALSLNVVLRHSTLTLCVLGLTIGLNIYLYTIVPKGFFPQQDTGRIMGSIRGDQSISFQAMQQKLTTYVDIIRHDPAVETVAGFTGGGQRNGGSIFIALKALNERQEAAPKVIARLNAKLSKEPGAAVFLMAAQDIRVGGRSSRSQYQYTLQSDNLDTLRLWGQKLQTALKQLPELQGVDSDLEEKGLQITLDVDRNTMSRYGVTMQQVNAALYNAFGQRQVSTMYSDKNQYKVVLEFAPPWWQGPEDLQRVWVAAHDGTLVPLSTFTRYAPTHTSLAVAHQGQFAAITLSFNLAPGVSLSQATVAINTARRQLHMPATVTANFQGTARAYADTMKNQLLLIGAALITLYIVLGVLYESLIHPLTILSTLPSAGVGALLALMACGKEFSVIALIAVLLLCGIVKKNAIMMVDFAIAATRSQNMPPFEAIYTACILRFRPIMMTTLAAMLGAVPLALGQGDGAELRTPLGISVVGGLAVSQLLTLYTTPVVYLCLDRLRLRLRTWWRKPHPNSPAAVHKA